MIEFASGYRQRSVEHMTQNYFPLVTREPFPEMYTDAARNNPNTNNQLVRAQNAAKEAFAFFALSEVALLLLASFGKPHEVRGAKRVLQNRRVAQRIGTAMRLPYSVASVPLV